MEWVTTGGYTLPAPAVRGKGLDRGEAARGYCADDRSRTPLHPLATPVMDHRARIRPARPDDAEALGRLLTHLGYPTGAEAAARRLARVLDRPDYRTLVAEDGEQVVGVVAVFTGYGFTGDAPYARILSLVVDPEHRGGGVGAALVSAAESWARGQGAESLHLTTATHREGAHRFYRRLGYEVTGTRFYRRLD